MSEYIIPAGYGEAEYIDKKSRFIGQVQHAESVSEAMAFVESVRRKHTDATHNVWAYVLADGQMRWSDDGEPGGTSGQPTLNVFRSAGVCDVVCVVTRYFGGILLGTGGLVRAYTQGAQVAVAAAGVQRMSLYTVALIACPYNLYDIVTHLLPEYDCAVEETDYGADVTLTVTLPAGGEDRLNAGLAEATAGTVYAEVMETKFMGRRVK